MRNIKTEILIATEPEIIWEVLLDFKHYPNWNPFIKSIEGEKAVGKKLKVLIQPPNGKEMAFQPEILVFETNKELRWLGRAGIKGIFDGEHYFLIEKQDNGITKFIHGEKFSGILISLMRKTLDKTSNGFEQMNEALKKECESLFS